MHPSWRSSSATRSIAAPTGALNCGFRAPASRRPAAWRTSTGRPGFLMPHRSTSQTPMATAFPMPCSAPEVISHRSWPTLHPPHRPPTSWTHPPPGAVTALRARPGNLLETWGTRVERMVDRRYQGAGPASPPPVRPQACQCRPAAQNASRARTCGHGRSTSCQLSMVLAFSEWWRNSIRDRSVAGQAKARVEGRFPGRRPSLTEQQREYIRVERSKGVSQRELAKLLEVSRWTIQQVDE